VTGEGPSGRENSGVEVVIFTTGGSLDKGYSTREERKSIVLTEP
jgi:hypothetical protein